MKIDITQSIRSFKGEPLKNENGEEITFQTIFLNVLGAPKQGESGKDKLSKFDLGVKCVADEVDLDLDERKLIKDLVADSGVGAVVYGRVCQLFEGEDE